MHHHTHTPVRASEARRAIFMAKRDKSVVYRYGMRLRGYSIGCQPKDGFIKREDDESGRYYDILVYDRQLTDRELEAYELDFIGRETE